MNEGSSFSSSATPIPPTFCAQWSGPAQESPRVAIADRAFDTEEQFKVKPTRHTSEHGASVHTPENQLQGEDRDVTLPESDISAQETLGRLWKGV